MTGLALIVLAAWAYLLAAHGRFWLSAPELAPAAPAAAPPVAVIVPARDEAATIGPALTSLLAQDYPGKLTVVLVDDASSDGTAAIACAAWEAHPGRAGGIVRARPRPAGWTGKLWAVAEGIAALGEEPALYLLTDADIVHDPRHLATLVAKAEAERLDLVSEMVRLNCASTAEHWLIPAFVYFFQLLYPFAWVNTPSRATAAAAGGTILLRRAALERIGGIAAVRGALIDDVALAGRVKRGGPIWLGHAGLARSIRPYPHAADIWRMIARTAFVQLRHSWSLLALCLLGLALVFMAPPLLLFLGGGSARWIGLLAWLGIAASCVPTLRRYGLSPWRGLALPAVAAFYMAATAGSALDHARGRGVVWKGRAYGGAA